LWQLPDAAVREGNHEHPEPPFAFQPPSESKIITVCGLILFSSRPPSLALKA